MVTYNRAHSGSEYVGGIAVLIRHIRNQWRGMTEPQVFADGSQRHPTDVGISHGDSRDCDQQQRYRHSKAAPIRLHVHFATTVDRVLVARPSSARFFSFSPYRPSRHDRCRRLFRANRAIFDLLHAPRPAVHRPFASRGKKKAPPAPAVQTRLQIPVVSPLIRHRLGR